ncbi:MAG: hypothetical protein BGP04_25150 [Rhizobiales bacterium 62-17]|nr:MAG: hypothetical protein BGP04_25150 [Rhizobiales bacterium 62-17]
MHPRRALAKLDALGAFFIVRCCALRFAAITSVLGLSLAPRIWTQQNTQASRVHLVFLDRQPLDDGFRFHAVARVDFMPVELDQLPRCRVLGTADDRTHARFRLSTSPVRNLTGKRLDLALQSGGWRDPGECY